MPGWIAVPGCRRLMAGRVRVVDGVGDVGVRAGEGVGVGAQGGGGVGVAEAGLGGEDLAAVDEEVGDAVSQPVQRCARDAGLVADRSEAVVEHADESRR